jgi:signal transduction histidine kinase
VSARPRLSLGEQAMLVLALYSMLLATAVGVLLYRGLSQALTRSHLARMVETSERLAEQLSLYLVGEDPAGLDGPEVYRMQRRPDLAYLRVLDARGKTLLARVGPAGTPLALERSRTTGVSSPSSRRLARLLEVAVPVRVPASPSLDAEEDPSLVPLVPLEGQGEVVGTLVAAYGIGGVEGGREEAVRQATLVAATVLLFGIAFSYVASRSMGGALERMTHRAERLADGELIQEPLPVEGQGEVRELSEAFNIMMEGLRERDEQLRRYSGGLEDEVASRTRQLRTEAMRLENANELLRLQYGRAQAADRAKSEFLTTMSHELRTPLTSILGFTRLLLEGTRGPLGEEQRADLQVITRAASHLLALINDLLDHSLVESGRLTMELEEVELPQLATDLQEVCEGLDREPGVELSIEVEPGAPAPLADRQRLLQVALNLTSNALKFTSQGEVEVRFRGADGTFVLEVRDSGPGIPEELQDHVFEPFTQADQSVTRSYTGTGLGLSISRKLVVHMGGTLELRTTSDTGSVFSVSLPAAPGGRAA